MYYFVLKLFGQHSFDDIADIDRNKAQPVIHSVECFDVYPLISFKLVTLKEETNQRAYIKTLCNIYNRLSCITIYVKDAFSKVLTKNLQDKTVFLKTSYSQKKSYEHVYNQSCFQILYHWTSFSILNVFYCYVHAIQHV